MSASMTIWRAHFRSLGNAARYDARMRVALIVGPIFSLLIGLWGESQLSHQLKAWLAQGPAALETGLWTLCLLAWSGMFGLALLSGLLRTFGDDEALLLFTQPLTPATRFRILYGSFFIENLWTWLLLEIGITGYVLVSVLGWQALTWLALLQLGVAVTILSVLLSALLAIQYLLPRRRRKTCIVVVTLFALLGVCLIGVLFLKARSVQATHVSISWPRPELVSALFVVFLAVCLGPLARPLGRLYSAAFPTVQGWNRSRKAFTFPCIHALTRLLARRRTLTGALFVKMLLSQSRNFISWGRLAIALLVLAFFPQIHTVTVHVGWSDPLFVAVFAAALALFGVVEQAPGAISGEANRLTLYLVAPLTSANLLCAKLLLFALPVLLQGLAASIFLAWHFALPIGQAGFALSAMALVILGILTLLVWGSTWDEDLNMTIEGAMQTMLHEETAITPRRMWLLNLALISFALMVLVLWKLPPVLAIVSLIGFDIIVLLGMWRVSYIQLKRWVQG